MSTLFLKRSLARKMNVDSPQWDYGLAVIGSLLFLLVAFFSPLLVPPATLFIFLIPVLLVSSLGGIGPGVVATLVTGVGAFLFAPGWVPGHWMVLSLYVAEGIGISLLGSGLKNAKRRLKRIEADRANIEAATRMHLMVESIQDYAIFMLDPEGHVATWNEGARKIKGYSAQEIIGQSFSLFYPEEEKNSGKPQWGLKEATQKGRFVSEGWRIRKDGSRFWAHVVITRLQNQEGKLIGFVKVTHDLTERKLSEELKAQIIKTEEAGRLRSQLLAIASHELRTPLNAIIGYSTLLDDPRFDEQAQKRKEMIGRIQFNARQLLDLVNNILDLSNMQIGSKGRIEELLVSEVLTRVVEGLRPAADRKGLTLSLQEPLPARRIRSDSANLHRLFTNLITNAIEFTDRGSVTVRFIDRPAERRISVEIVDTGIGISEMDLPRIFEPFYQCDQTMTRRFSGTGLGLAIVKELLTTLMGTVQVESRLGSGSTFAVSLPYEL